jgi:hypothetical protein
MWNEFRLNVNVVNITWNSSLNASSRSTVKLLPESWLCRRGSRLSTLVSPLELIAIFLMTNCFNDTTVQAVLTVAGGVLTVSRWYLSQLFRSWKLNQKKWCWVCKYNMSLELLCLHCLSWSHICCYFYYQLIDLFFAIPYSFSIDFCSTFFEHFLIFCSLMTKFWWKM